MAHTSHTMAMIKKTNQLLLSNSNLEDNNDHLNGMMLDQYKWSVSNS